MITMLGGLRGVGRSGQPASKITTGIDVLIEHAQAIFDASYLPEEGATHMATLLEYRSLIQLVEGDQAARPLINTLINHLRTVFGPAASNQAGAAALSSFINHVQTVYGPGLVAQAGAAGISTLISYDV